MTFFSFAFLENAMSFEGYFKYITIFVSLGALLVVTSLYLRHRLQTKYRDLSIIFLLLIIFLLGVQYKQYERNEVYAADISSLVTFLNSVKDSQNLQKEDIRTNSRTLMNGMILNIRDQYFEVHFNNDFSAYTLSPINLVNPNVTVIDKDVYKRQTPPELTALFNDFMKTKAQEAQAVYILGDLFDFWIGDDEISPLISQVKQLIKNLTEKGIACYFIHGNRDFLIGKKFAQDCGLMLLLDYHCVDLYGVKTLICHGDTLCVDDVKYQQFRRKVHQNWRQRLFLCLPLKVRLKIAEKIRAKKMCIRDSLNIVKWIVCWQNIWFQSKKKLPN